MLSDLITAIATAPGRGALAVVRVSGQGAFEAVRRFLGWADSLPVVPRQAILATFHESDGTPFDRGLVTFFPAPASYTGEDVVELSCHGGALVPAQLLAALQALGARLAWPGEFTRRAVQNGKLDLLQAEAVGDLIDATTRAQGRGALRQLDGGLSRRLDELRYELLELTALLSYEIDFPEEDDGPISPETIRAGLESSRGAVSALLRTAPVGERVRRGALVVLAGRPNAGKSSLFNALLGIDRALVTEIPGTTRDAIEAELDLDGWPVRLADTAGLRDATDRIERLGIEVSQRYLAAADLTILCVEAGARLTDEEHAMVRERATVLVRTKSDLGAVGDDGGLPVSAVTGDGLPLLATTLVDRLFGEVEQFADVEPLLTRERHRLALERAEAALVDAEPHIGARGDAVLAAHHVRRAITALDELIGAVDVEDVLGAIFERFCVGK